MHPLQEGPVSKYKMTSLELCCEVYFELGLRRIQKWKDNPPLGDTNAFEEHLERQAVGKGKAICLLQKAMFSLI